MSYEASLRFTQVISGVSFYDANDTVMNHSLEASAYDGCIYWRHLSQFGNGITVILSRVIYWQFARPAPGPWQLYIVDDMS